MLFKILRGNEANLPQTLTDGYCYFLKDKHYFYVDYKDGSGALVRSKLSAEFADKLRYVEDGEIVEITPEEITSLISRVSAIESADFGAAIEQLREADEALAASFVEVSEEDIIALFK